MARKYRGEINGGSGSLNNVCSAASTWCFVVNDKCCSVLGIGEEDAFTRKIYALLLGREHFLCLLFLNYLHFKIILMP